MVRRPLRRAAGLATSPSDSSIRPCWRRSPPRYGEPTLSTDGVARRQPRGRYRRAQGWRGRSLAPPAPVGAAVDQRPFGGIGGDVERVGGQRAADLRPRPVEPHVEGAVGLAAVSSSCTADRAMLLASITAGDCSLNSPIDLPSAEAQAEPAHHLAQRRAGGVEAALQAPVARKGAAHGKVDEIPVQLAAGCRTGRPRPARPHRRSWRRDRGMAAPGDHADQDMSPAGTASPAWRRARRSRAVRPEPRSI